MYRFGLFATLALLVCSSLAMWFRFGGGEDGFSSTLPPALISAAFIVEFLGSTFLAYLLFVSVTRIKDPINSCLLQISNVVLWQAMLYLNVYGLLSGTFLTALNHERSLMAVIVAIFILFAVGFCTVIARKRLKFNASLESVTVVTIALFAAGYLFLRWTNEPLVFAGFNILFLVVVALFLLGLRRISGNMVLSLAAGVFVVLDECYMLLIGFSQLEQQGTIGLSIVYLALLLGAAFLVYRDVAKNQPKARVSKVRFGFLLAFELSLFDIIMRSSLDFRIELFLLVTVVVLVAFHFTHLDEPTVCYRIMEFATALLACFRFIDAIQNPESEWTSVGAIQLTIAACVCFVLFLERIRLAAASNAKAIRETGKPLETNNIEGFTGFVITVLFLSLLYGLAPWFTLRSPLSLMGMLIALVVIALGFWSRVSGMRVYGLVVVILCVLKLVTYDISDADLIMRVVAFIGGGLICFGISALYNFTVKRIAVEVPPNAKKTTSEDNPV